MEKEIIEKERKEILSTTKVCRFCLTAEENLIPLYDNKTRAPNIVPFSLKILACIAIEIFPSDNMPKYICSRCKLFMELSYAFKQLCRKADESILHFIQNGTQLAPLSWPTQLSKVYKAVNKAEVNVVKTVVQGGATVRVMAEEVSDSEEGEEDNVYNVKIGDGSEEGKSIKIITSVDQTAPKSRQATSKKFASTAKLTRHVREHAGVRAYPCKHCDKSFTKSHHYTRHLRMKHSERTRTPGPYNPSEKTETFRCNGCDETLSTQDELIYHSALHATRDLVCPLCQEKFDDVDTVTTHIKSHTNGTEFQCVYCELVFTTKEKLDTHLTASHDEELSAADQETENDESSMDMDAEDEDDNTINVKEENGEMVVEIKKAGEFMLPAAAEEERGDITLSEDSDMNTDSPVTESEVMPTPKQAVVPKQEVATKTPEATVKEAGVVIKPALTTSVVLLSPTPSSILRKAEDIKRKAVVIQQQPGPVVYKKDKAPTKAETISAATGASDKSLRLLEKELQDLKRTNSRTEAAKTPAKPVESLRSRRAPLFSSTPKPRTADKKEVVALKTIPEKTASEKKLAERKGKDTKEPKDIKSNNNSIKEDKELKIVKEDKGNREDKEQKGNKEEKEQKGNTKEDKLKEEKKENSKAVVKNGANDASGAEDTVRRSTRPSKVKDYAKMIRDSSLESDDDNTDADEDEEDYKEPEKTPETSRIRGRRTSHKPLTPTPRAPAAAATPSPAPRKRGRPRKEPRPVVPSKIKKDDPSEEEADSETAKGEAASSLKDDAPKENKPDNGGDGSRTPESNKISKEPRPGVIISPSGQTLKKVPIKALPPGVKPLPLPVSSRLGGGEVTEMQIGRKIVKVQKIVMTKAEVEAMTKKGLLEIKDGTMVLKQGIKLPAADSASLRSTLAREGESSKESPRPLPMPTRCDLED